jgi:hypothetical protein
VTERRRRRRSGWVPDPFGALASFVIEAAIVVVLGLVTFGVAALGIWLA